MAHKLLVATVLLTVLTSVFGCAHHNLKDAAIDREGIRSAISAKLRDYGSCYGQALKRDHDIEGKVVVKWHIVDHGQIADAKVLDTSTVKDPELGNCVVEILKSTTFPEPPKNEYAEVIYPFVFGKKKMVK